MAKNRRERRQASRIVEDVMESLGGADGVGGEVEQEMPPVALMPVGEDVKEKQQALRESPNIAGLRAVERTVDRFSLLSDLSWEEIDALDGEDVFTDERIIRYISLHFYVSAPARQAITSDYVTNYPTHLEDGTPISWHGYNTLAKDFNGVGGASLRSLVGGALSGFKFGFPLEDAKLTSAARLAIIAWVKVLLRNVPWLQETIAGLLAASQERLATTTIIKSTVVFATWTAVMLLMRKYPQVFHRGVDWLKMAAEEEQSGAD